MSEHKPPTDDELAYMQAHAKTCAKQADLWRTGIPLSAEYLDRCLTEIKRLRAEIKRLEKLTNSLDYHLQQERRKVKAAWDGEKQA